MIKINYKLRSKIKNINNQISYGGLPMSTYKIPDDITAKVNSINSAETKKKKYEDIYSKLDNINAKFDTSNSNVEVPDNIKLDRLEFNKPSEEEIAKQSETSLSDYKNSSLKNIDNEYKTKENELQNSKTDLISTTDETKNKLSGYYDNAKKETEDQALKRGLARSSIVISQLDAFNKSELNDFKVLDEKLNNEINTINFELNALNSQKSAALSDFNIAYAVKLQDKISSLTDELNKKESEVSKYNNEIAIKEAEYNKSLQELKQKLENEKWDKESDLIDIYGKYGANIIEKVKQDEAYNVGYEYLQNLSNEERQELLNDETFIKKMGTAYDKLKKAFSK